MPTLCLVFRFLAALMVLGLRVSSADADVEIENPNLENAMRDAIQRPTGSLSKADLASPKFTSLKVINTTIDSLDGLQYCSSLTNLSLTNCEIDDIEPLGRLTRLTTLRLGGNNIKNIQPLSLLSNLTSISLWDNEIEDISPLVRLYNLEYAILINNNISDISPLLESKFDHNEVRINLSGNPLDEAKLTEQIPLLEARGIVITFGDEDPGRWMLAGIVCLYALVSISSVGVVIYAHGGIKAVLAHAFTPYNVVGAILVPVTYWSLHLLLSLAMLVPFSPVSRPLNGFLLMAGMILIPIYYWRALPRALSRGFGLSAVGVLATIATLSIYYNYIFAPIIGRLQSGQPSDWNFSDSGSIFSDYPLLSMLTFSVYDGTLIALVVFPFSLLFLDIRSFRQVLREAVTEGHA